MGQLSQIIEKEIGEVTMYSDKEGSYTGNFYYSIKGISSDIAIAIREPDGRYRKAIRDGKYGDNK